MQTVHVISQADPALANGELTIGPGTPRKCQSNVASINGYSMHQTRIGMIVVDGIVLNGAIVPNGN
jgi:hypothetical protein